MFDAKYTHIVSAAATSWEAQVAVFETTVRVKGNIIQ